MNIGLVLSGGMAKGAFQIGALKALAGFISAEKIKYISCASVGVLNGYAFATNQLDRAEEMWKSICTDNKKLSITKLLKSDITDKITNELCKKDDPLDSFFYTSLLNLNKKNIVYINLASVSHETINGYLKASVAVPVYRSSIEVEGTEYYDGAAVDNIPVYPLLDTDLDYLICIYFDDISYKFESSEFDGKVIRITFPAKTRFKESLIFTKEGIDSMIEEGYKKTEAVLNSVFKNGLEDTEHICKTIADINSNSKRITRVTGDVLINNLNKVIQKITTKKIKI